MASQQFLTDDELDQNYVAFKAALPDLLPWNRGRFVVVREGDVKDLFDTSRDAFIFGWRHYKDDRFSVQEVTDEPVYLGIFSHAVDRGNS
jgi:hypothetical protein